MYKLGDTGLVVEFINSRLGIRSKVFTEETKTKLKQFQAAYRQYLKDETKTKFSEFWNNIDNLSDASSMNFNYDPYAQIYYELDNPAKQDITHTTATEPVYEIYPNGVCDMWTLQALTEIDIETYDNGILEQVQRVLSKTEYTYNEDLDIKETIDPTGIYDELTHKAIKKFQMGYNIGQEKIPIYEHKNLLSNIKEEWGNFTYYYSLDGSVIKYPYTPTVEYPCIKLSVSESTKLPQFNAKTLLSPFVELESGYSYYISIQNSVDYYIKLQFFRYNNSDTGNRLIYFANNLEPYDATLPENLCGFENWVDDEVNSVAITPGNQVYEGIIYPNYYSPYDISAGRKTNINYSINYVRVMLRRMDGEDISLDELDNLQIQLEKGPIKTDYEPYSQTVSNSYQSGYINIPTYNKIKQVFDIKEADF